MSTTESKKLHCLLAEFENPATLMAAAEKVNKAGYKKYDAYSPFPIHGMDDAMGLKESKLGWIVLFHAIIGFAGGFFLQYWTSSIAYPLNISGKPFVNIPNFVPVTFELTILLAAFGTFFGMFMMNKLPKLNNPLFNSDRFEKVTDDGFFIGIESEDSLFSEEKTAKLLEEAGAVFIEKVYED